MQFAIDGDAPGFDPFFGITAGTETGTGNAFGQPFRGCVSAGEKSRQISCAGGASCLAGALGHGIS